VAFRAKEYQVFRGKTAYPLLWMQNVHPMRVRWPNPGGNKHPEYFKRDVPQHVKNSLLVVPQNMVLLRRFSPKEQERRVMAAPFCPDELGTDSEYVGIENHLNYIYATGDRELTVDEAWGLSALLMGETVDRYVRLCNGNTQVSSTELRRMPLPPRAVLSRIGCAVRGERPRLPRIDEVVQSIVDHESGGVLRSPVHSNGDSGGGGGVGRLRRRRAEADSSDDDVDGPGSGTARPARRRRIVESSDSDSDTSSPRAAKSLVATTSPPAAAPSVASVTSKGNSIIAYFSR
jgi:hypothetical protein